MNKLGEWERSRHFEELRVKVYLYFPAFQELSVKEFIWQLQTEMSNHEKLKSEHCMLRKNYDELEVELNRLRSMLDENSVIDKGEAVSYRIIELEQLLAEECRLNEDLRESLTNITSEKGAYFPGVQFI